jgi:SecD/SecF fusion protein
MTSVASLPLLFGANRLLPPGVGEKLELPGSLLFALFLGTVISLLGVFILMIWKQLKLDGGQYLLWSLVGAILLSPIIYFAFLFKDTGIYVLDIFRLSEATRLGLDARKISGVIYIPIVLFVASFVLGVLMGKWLRLKEMGWRFGLIIGSCLAAVAIIALGEFKLGVDLQGGVILVYEVDEVQTNKLLPPDKQDQWDMAAVAKTMQRRLNPDGLKELVIRVTGPKQIELVVPEVDDAEIAELKLRATTGGALQFLIVADNPSLDRNVIDRAREQAASKNNVVKVDDRVRDKDGNIIGMWKGVARQKEGDDLSPFRDASVANAVLRDHATGDILELTDVERAKLVDVLVERKIKKIEVLLRYDSKLDLKGDDLAFASAGKDEDLSPCIHFTMKGDGISKMGQLTSTFRQRKLAIVFDNNLLSAPTIQSQITDRGQITGRFSQEEVDFMVEILRSGSMPVVLKHDPISENKIGSLLGLETIISGGRSIAISLIVVLLFTAVYYRFAGFVACAALVLNIILTVAIMVMLQAPFTLPGLAGIVLTVGMSVDSNVLIFERIREELAKGAALRMALRNGFDRAMTTIIDSNLTTLLTAVVLYAIGTDQVRGFGITLTLGIITSMFTAIFCARTVFEAGERLKSLKTLTMMKFFTRTNVDWCKWFPVATIASVILIAVGLVATVARGMGIFDIDLAGGTSVTMILREKMSDQDVRKKLEENFAKLQDSGVKGRIDYTVYEISFQGHDPQTVYQILSNIPNEKVLQKAIQEAFRKPDGSEGLQTHKLDISNVKSVSRAGRTSKEGTESSPGGAGPFESTGSAAKTEPEKTAPEKSVPEKPAPEKTEPAKEAKKEEKPTEEKPAAEEKKEAEKPAEEKPCGVQDEKKAEEKKAEEPAKAETPKAETPAKEPAKSVESKADETKSEPSTSTKAPPTTPPAAETPGPDAEPAEAPPAAGQFFETTADIKFPGNKISGGELKERLEKAVESALSQKHPVAVTRKDETSGRQWDGRDSTAHEDWTVTLPIPEAQAKIVLGELKSNLEKTPVWQATNKIEGQVTVDTQLKALTAILLSLLGIVAYVWFRFQSLSWGIAAVVALVHDTLVMLGFIAMSYWMAGALGFMQVEEFKISLTIVAAFLTLIGYSINDTIVIFDRIREIRGKSPDLTRHMINESVNQTMSRTILTTGTVLMTVLVLYFAGGSGIHAFAFSMIVGAVAGTYSTVFIAAPLLLWLHNKPGPAGGKVAKSIITEKASAAARQ